MKKNLLTIALFFLVAFSLYSQNPPDTLWTRTFGGIELDIAKSVQQTTDGGYIVTGYVGSGDIWLIKTDANGNEEWNQTFGGIYQDVGHAILQTTDGGYIIAGFTNSFGVGNSDVWLIKTDLNGNEMWNQTYGGIDGDIAFSVQQTIDGGYIVAGYTISYGAGEADIWLIKTNENGNEEWNYTFGGYEYDTCYSVQQTIDGGFIVAGKTNSYGSGLSDSWLIKTDANGNEEWNQTFGGNFDDGINSVQQTIDEGYIVTGFTGSFGAGNFDFWVIKTDLNGNEMWNQTFGGSSNDIANSIKQTTDGGFILCGVTDSYGAGSSDFWLIKLECELIADFSANPVSGYSPLNVIFTDESFGNPITWEWDFNNDGIIDSYIQNPTFTYNQPGIYSVALTVYNGTNEDTIIKEDYMTVLEPIEAEFSGTPLNGCNPLEVNFTDLSSGEPTSWLWDFDNDGFIDSNEQNPAYIYVDAGVYTVSLTVSDGNSEDTEIKVDYITVTTTSSQNVIIPIETKLYQNHPNPFNPKTSIGLDIKEHENGILSIYNVKGQLIDSRQFESGKHNFVWDASKQSSGLYLYKLIVNNKTVATKKCLLLK